MARLIDVDSAVKAISRLAEDMSINDRAVALLLALELNNEDRFPAADVVPVVRCRDCKYWVRKKLGGRCDLNIRLGTSYNWFCADGKKVTE